MEFNEAKKIGLKVTLKDFNTSLSLLRQDLSNDKEIEQNHFGDFLMIKEPLEWGGLNSDNYKVWFNHRENVKQGSPQWEIEYAGQYNGYKWETIAKG